MCKYGQNCAAVALACSAKDDQGFRFRVSAPRFRRRAPP